MLKWLSLQSMETTHEREIYTVHSVDIAGDAHTSEKRHGLILTKSAARQNGPLQVV